MLVGCAGKMAPVGAFFGEAPTSSTALMLTLKTGKSFVNDTQKNERIRRWSAMNVPVDASASTTPSNGLLDLFRGGDHR